MNISTDLQYIIDVVKEAGNIIMSYYDRRYDVQKKNDKTPVTEADLASEKFIREKLSQQYDHPILSEETEDDLSRLESDMIWIVDPIDGTRSFIERVEHFCIIIALVSQQQPLLGVVYKPPTKELYFAERGKGAYKQTDDGPIEKLVPSRIDTLSEMSLVVSRFYAGDKYDGFMKYLNISRKGLLGSAGVKTMSVCEGQHDIHINASGALAEWDVCAPQLILEEAGGKVTDTLGTPLKYNQENIKKTNGFLATNGLRHDLIVQKIASFRQENDFF